MLHAVRFLGLCLALQLVGCASSPLQQSISALVKGELGQAGPSIATASLNPTYRYLRADLDGASSALLVLAYVEPHPGGTVEVWYSALGEVIKTQQGRIVGTAGLSLDWVSVVYPTPPPAWPAWGGETSVYERVRSELPSYRFGVMERLVISPVPQPVAGQLPSVLFGGGLLKADASKYRWYQEKAVGAVATDLPASWFALGWRDGREVVVFSRQCLALNMCMNLQLWPAQDGAVQP